MRPLDLLRCARNDGWGVGRFDCRALALSVSSEDGKLVGTITPFGATVGQTSLDYTLPLPKSAASGGPVRLRMEMLKPGDASRPPTPNEVLGVQLVYVPVSDSKCPDGRRCLSRHCELGRAAGRFADAPRRWGLEASMRPV